MGTSQKSSIDWWYLRKQPNSTWPPARLKLLSQTRLTILVSPVLKIQFFHLEKEFVPANKDTSSIKKPINVSVLHPSNLATKLVHVSACVPRTSQDGTPWISCVKHVLLISLLSTDKPAVANLVPNCLLCGINSLINANLVPKTLIMFRTFPNAFHARMTKNMIKVWKNAYQFANPTKFITNNKENAIHLKNSTDANAANVTTPRWKSVKMYAITDFNGFLQIRNAAHLPFHNSKTGANTTSVWTSKPTNANIIATVQLHGMIERIMSASELGAQLNVNARRFLTTWRESAFRKAISVLSNNFTTQLLVSVKSFVPMDKFIT